MKKRWIALLTACLLLIMMLAVPVSAQEDTDQAPGSSESGGAGESKPGGGTDESKPDGGTDESKPDGGTDESKPDGGTDESKPDGGTDESVPDGGTDESKPDGGTDESKPDGGDPDNCEHDWVGGEVVVEPSCKEPGVRGYVCTICGAIGVEPIPKLTTHTYDSPCDGECNVCGETREATHSFSKGWDYNSTKHWHPCSRCGAKKDEGDHYPGPAATEDKDQICLTCGKVMTYRKSHTHDKESKWTWDETGHWHACKGCEEQLDFKAHVYNGACGTPCTECGYIPQGGHVYEQMWRSNDAEHWKVCIVCGEEDLREPHAMSGEGGEEVCTICAYAPTAESGHVHQFSGAWISDGSGHWQRCDCGEASERSPHAWKISDPNEDGIVTYICGTCMYEKTEMTEAPEASSDFPIVPVLVFLGVITVGMVVILLVILKKPRKQGHFSEKR